MTYLEHGMMSSSNPVMLQKWEGGQALQSQQMVEQVYLSVEGQPSAFPSEQVWTGGVRGLKWTNLNRLGASQVNKFEQIGGGYMGPPTLPR